MILERFPKKQFIANSLVMQASQLLSRVGARLTVRTTRNRDTTAQLVLRCKGYDGYRQARLTMDSVADVGSCIAAGQSKADTVVLRLFWDFSPTGTRCPKTV